MLQQSLEERGLLFEDRQCSNEHSLFGVLFVFRERKPRIDIHLESNQVSLQISKLSLSLSLTHINTRALAHNHTGNDRCRLVTHCYNKRRLFEYKIEARSPRRESEGIGPKLEQVIVMPEAHNKAPVAATSFAHKLWTRQEMGHSLKGAEVGARN